MIKVIIANNNDILYNSLSNMILQKGLNIDIENISTDKLSSLKFKTKEKVIILDSITSISFCMNILKNAIKQVGKENIIILVVNSENIKNIINKKRHVFLFKKRTTNFSLFDTINLVSESLKDTIEIEKNVDTILWKLGFTSYFKGTIYLKDAILIAFNDKNLLTDANTLIKKVAEKNNILNDKVVRSDIDRALNHVLDYIDIKVIYDIFNDSYDGRKISLKYFIDLCIRYLENQKYLCIK